MDFGHGLVAMRSLRSGQVYLAAATLAFSAVTIVGCVSTIAVEISRNSAHQVETVSKAATAAPDPALLRRQSEPDCAFRGPVSDPVTAEETRQKLDYEQQCYRASERIVRARLEHLQDAVQKFAHQAEAVPNVAMAALNPSLLRRQPEPECAFRSPVSDPITAEETRQKLDYEQQCYRASERIVRARLEHLQDAVQKMIKSRKATVASGSYGDSQDRVVSPNEINGCLTPVAKLLMFLVRTGSPCATGATKHGKDEITPIPPTQMDLAR